jgi:hypothetical protein
MKGAAVSVVAPCSLVEVYRRFRDVCFTIIKHRAVMMEAETSLKHM